MPAEWVEDVRAADEDRLLALTAHLPAEAAEAVLELATGGKPRVSAPEAPSYGTPLGPFTHPDAQRRFRVVTGVEELERALEAPWEKWAVFLHPDQRDLVSRDFSGPARVSGSAGTGKTIVALHRAVHLARALADGRVLLATFSEPLAHALRANLKRLIGNEPRTAERLEVHAMTALGLRLHQAQLGPVRLAPAADLSELLRDASAVEGDHKFSPAFLRAEWDHVVDAWQLRTWEAYRDVQRLGRRTRLPESRRAVLWRIFERVRTGLVKRGLTTEPRGFRGSCALAGKPGASVRCGHRRRGSRRQHRAVTLPGGTGWLPAERAVLLRRPWPTHLPAALLLEVPRSGRPRPVQDSSSELPDVAPNPRGRRTGCFGGRSRMLTAIGRIGRYTVSVFNGPPPRVHTYPNEVEESKAVVRLVPVFEPGRRPRARNRGSSFVQGRNCPGRSRRLKRRTWRPGYGRPGRGQAGARGASPRCIWQKGLEFRAVAVMACDDEVLPLQERIENVGDDGDLQEVYDTERQLLYVACTRARDRLSISAGSRRLSSWTT